MDALEVQTIGDRAELASDDLTLGLWLQRAPFTLAMSSGFFSFYAHAGLLSALVEAGVHPARLTGSSAGGLIAGLWAGGLDADAVRDQLAALKRSDFWDPRPGFGLLRGQRFRSLLERVLPVSTFAHCRVPLTVSAFDLASRRTRALNEGSLAPALHATCALPLLFQPVHLDGRWLIDGGVADRPGLAGARPSEPVLYHNIVSRSPWRRRDSPTLQAPQRERLITLEIHGVTRVNPFALERGMAAYAQVRRATLAALDRPLFDRFRL
jgi:NTE family protein